MGLDMYLTKKAYVKNWSHMTEDQKHEVTIKKGGKVVKSKFPISQIEFEVGTWRKANQIHSWFVENVQDGEDDCLEHYVEPAKLRELLSRVNTVLGASVLIDGDVENGHTYENGVEKPIIEKGKIIEDSSMAQELLPARDGFFFGGAQYDEWYYSQLEETKDILENAMVKDSIEGEFYYQSSW